MPDNPRETDINWREPADYWLNPFFPVDTSYDAVLILERKDEGTGDLGYDTVLISGRNGEIYADAPLAEFKMRDIRIEDFNRWALVTWQISAIQKDE